MPRPGELRHRVTILAPVTTRDDSGQQVEGTPETIAAGVPAKITAAGGGETSHAGQVSAVGSYTVEIRYRSDVTEQHYLSWDGRRLNITTLQDLDGKRRFLTIACREQK